MNDLPSSAAGFALAHQRLATQDAERAEYLAKRCGLPDEDEEREPIPPPEPGMCPCGCGRPVAERKAKVGRTPIYATRECRYRSQARLSRRSAA